MKGTGAYLQEGWVIANHILVSFHAAFISSILVLPSAEILKGEVLKFIFFSPETITSAIIMYFSFHAGIALHEMGHFLTAAKLKALNDHAQERAAAILGSRTWRKIPLLLKIFLTAPFGKASGIKREGLNYYPDAPYNFAVAAAGPRMSRNVALVTLPPAILLISTGLFFDMIPAIYAGRLCLGVGVVSLLDFLIADPGKYKAFRQREARAKQKAASIERDHVWWESSVAAKGRLLTHRIQEITHPRWGPVTAPWQFRNCGMGGRHTEKEYPESNISMQEAMFLILGARDYQEAQEMTVRLQNRLKEIIEKAEGCRVMGIGLEGGLAPFIDRGGYPIPEIRLWAMMKLAIEECGFRPGIDVAIALDPAMSELEIAYRQEFKMPDSVGMYLFWRDKAQTVLDREEILDLYVKAIQEHEIPILSIEDGFAEDDFEGWQKLLSKLGDRVLVIGDDLVTTNDATIAMAAAKGLINTVLIKANQIGSLYETILAMLVALGKGMELVVSHRSKSPNDDMEAQIALAVNALGLKAGGGANTERLIKYQAVSELLQQRKKEQEGGASDTGQSPLIRSIYAYEEPTNAGIPTVGATVEISLPDAGAFFKFRGATPLGTSAGSGEAIHLVDAVFEGAEYPEVIERYPELFTEQERGVYSFAGNIDEAIIDKMDDDDLSALYQRAQRYDGKGCLNAVENIHTIIAPAFADKAVTGISLKDIDRMLLSLELRIAERREKIPDDASVSSQISVMQRKQNLGMNAILSVSLAMARGLAHLKSQSLYEMLREEMYALIEKLARVHDVKISGSRFSDYVDALQRVNGLIEADGKELHHVLRDISGIYEVIDKGTERDSPSSIDRGEKVRDSIRETSLRDSHSQEEGELTQGEVSLIAAVNSELFAAFRDHSNIVARHEALHEYTRIKRTIAKRIGRFGILNNHVFIDSEQMFIPYLTGDNIAVHKVQRGNSEIVFTRPYSQGKIISDDVLKTEMGVTGEAIDLEGLLCDLDINQLEPVHVVRIRDFVGHLQKINASANRSEAIYVLRLLVARLSLFSFKKQLNAKNLQTEVYSLYKELTRFVNSPISERPPLLVRILVRDIAAVVTRPKLIDRLWNDTIDLAEIHIRGSDIINELRRSSHHAMGRNTLKLAQAYMIYLKTGDKKNLEEMGFGELTPADEKARHDAKSGKILGRIIDDLNKLMGSSETIARIREWQEQYAAILTRSEFGKSLAEEMDAVIDGMAAGNRWVYYHHLRIIRSRVIQYRQHLPGVASIVRRLDALLELKPDKVLFEGDRAEKELKNCVDRFISDVQQSYQRDLFIELEDIHAAYDRGEFYPTFLAICRLRKKLRSDLDKRAFPEQRLLLLELDCLLEEISYLALRQIANEYEEKGADFSQCLEIIRQSVQNLTHDGLHSRQLHDLAAMLRDERKTSAEIRNVIEQIQRNYHHIIQRVISPFEKIRERVGFTEEELRAALANIQRYMHDLNNVAFFTDIAHSFIEDIQEDQILRKGEETLPREAYDVLHLSHIEEIKHRVESDDLACNLRDLYGSKGSGLIYISYLNIPTRDGFILPTTLPQRKAHEDPLDNMEEVVIKHLGILEQDIASRDPAPKVFGNPTNPLLLAVRAGSVFSMPGILSTVLFVGLNDEIAEGLAEQDPWCAYDAYRRFLAIYGQAVWGVDMESYNIVEDTKRRYKVKYKYDLPWEGMKEIAEMTKDILHKEGLGKALEEVLRNPIRQLLTAIDAVFQSWNSEAARRYREIKGICNSWQSVAIIQEMALGNRKNEDIRVGMDETKASLTGVIPRTRVTELGMRAHTGDFKFSAAGEDLVGGLTKSISFRSIDELESFLPLLNRRLRHNVAKLRRFMGTDQEVEFTVENGVLSILQSRAAEIGKNKLERAFEDPGEEATRGIGIRGSAFRGLAVFDRQDLDEMARVDISERDDVDGIMLLLESPAPESIPLILSADALLAAKGGSTSHAAIAINGIENRDYCGVMSASGLHVDAKKKEAVITTKNGDIQHIIKKNDIISIHGMTGNVYVGTRKTI